MVQTTIMVYCIVASKNNIDDLSCCLITNTRLSLIWYVSFFSTSIIWSYGIIRYYQIISITTVQPSCHIYVRSDTNKMSPNLMSTIIISFIHNTISQIWQVVIYIAIELKCIIIFIVRMKISQSSIVTLYWVDLINCFLNILCTSNIEFLIKSI